MIQIQLRIKQSDDGFCSFAMDADENATILDLLETLRADKKPVPAYRHSCHHGSCGTCGALINGKEQLLCLARVGKCLGDRSDALITLEPLRGMSVIDGIAVHPGKVFEGIPDTSYLKCAGDRLLVEDSSFPSGACHRQCFEACIECGLCVSACPIQVPFIGPAALAAVNREREKNPGSLADMLLIAGAADGAAVCERHVACSRVCPQGVYPAKHIQMLKNALRAGGLPQ